MLGRGYLDAVADEAIEELARRAERRSGSIRGRIQRVREGSEQAPRIGRFGLVARRASLDEFIADALLGDMGLTSPLRPEELPNPEALLDDRKPGMDVDAAGLAALADYVRLLAIPARAEDDRGRRLFEQALCAVCHGGALR